MRSLELSIQLDVLPVSRKVAAQRISIKLSFRYTDCTRQLMEAIHRTLRFSAIRLEGSFLKSGRYREFTSPLALSLRLRRKFQDKLRQKIAKTVSDPVDIDDEIRYLIRTLNP